MHARSTLDEVVSENIRRLRGAQKPKGWSRVKLADRFNKYRPDNTREWNEWRVLDLEGGRPGTASSPVWWHELVTLCIIFDVLLWDLVLPTDDREIILSGDSLATDGWQVTQTHLVKAPELGEIVSGIAGKYVADPEKMQELKETFNKENVTVVEILDQQRSLQRLIDQLVDQATYVRVDTGSEDDPETTDGVNDSQKSDERSTQSQDEPT